MSDMQTTLLADDTKTKKPAKPTKKSDETKVLEFIERCGVNGATDHEIEIALRMTHQNASARRHALARRGRVAADARRQRATAHGRPAIVWVDALLCRCERDNPCETFVCKAPHHQGTLGVPACHGAFDEHPEWCNACCIKRTKPPRRPSLGVMQLAYENIRLLVAHAEKTIGGPPTSSELKTLAKWLRGKTMGLASIYEKDERPDDWLTDPPTGAFIKKAGK